MKNKFITIYIYEEHTGDRAGTVAPNSEMEGLNLDDVLCFHGTVEELRDKANRMVASNLKNPFWHKAAESIREVCDKQ